MVHHYKNRRVLLLGLGVSGQSAARFLLNRGAHVVGVDSKRDLLENSPEIASLRAQGLQVLHESDPCDVGSFGLVAVSPGVPSSHPHYVSAAQLAIPIVGEVELACSEMVNHEETKCVAITGTNGKTTVTSLVEHVLKVAGLNAVALGNIGTPMTAALVDPAQRTVTDVNVIELSSFQLETLHSRFIDAAVILNITPDHLDRYPSFEDYAKAKVRIGDLLKNSGNFYVEDRCYRDFKKLFGSHPVERYGYESSCYAYTDTENVFVGGELAFELPRRLQGKRSHDVENLIAAYLLCRKIGVSPQLFLSAYETFEKPHHRIEFVKEYGGVNFYDDSKGTNIDAVIRAVDSLEGEIVLIAGGVDKGAPYTPWLKAFGGKVKGICAIGQAAPKIASDLGKNIPVVLCETLEDAVKQAKALSQQSGTVLLSPGCSSYDMFKNYAHRGQEFQRVVHALHDREENK